MRFSRFRGGFLPRVLPFLLALAFVFFPTGDVFAAPILKQGSEGHDVRVLQGNLASLGYSVAVNGVFDNDTYRAVIAFQRDEKISISGNVDRATWQALKKRISGKPKVPKNPNKEKSPAAPRIPAKVPETDLFLPKGKVDAILKTAKKYTGTRYLFGGTTPKGFDCSGFVQYVFKQNGFALPRTADEQYKLGKSVKKRSDLIPGDLVFFSTYEKGASHCGIYVGSGKFIHVSSSKGVRVDSLGDSYWKPRWYGGKHIVKK